MSKNHDKIVVCLEDVDENDVCLELYPTIDNKGVVDGLKIFIADEVDDESCLLILSLDQISVLIEELRKAIEKR